MLVPAIEMAGRAHRTGRWLGLAVMLAGLAQVDLAGAQSRPGAPRTPRKPPHGHHGKGAPAGQNAPPPGSAPVDARALPAPTLVLDRTTLDNGLRVVLAPVPRASVVAVAMLYDAGARYDERGGAGLASLVRHAMSQGSANVLRGEHERHLASRGGQGWSEVTSERAVFVDVVPAAELPLALWLEADRLKSLQIPADGVAALRQELGLDQLRRAADPRAAGRARLREQVFQSLWAYEHDPLGGAEASALRADAVQAFHDARYTASNAVLVVAGDLDTEPAGQLVRRFFETARRQERPAALTAALPEQSSQRRAVVDAPTLTAPTLLYGWSTPADRTDDAAAAEAALYVLARLRLPQKLQREAPLAARIRLEHERQRVAGLARLEIDLLDAAGRTPVERAVNAELEALAQKGPSEAELVHFREDTAARAWHRLRSPDELALALGDAELLHGDARLLGEDVSLATALDRDKVRAAAARYLSETRRSFVELRSPTMVPSPASPPPPVAAPPAHGHGHKPPHSKPARPARPKH